MQSFVVHQQAENNAARITLFSVEMLPTTKEEYSLMSPTGSTTDQLNPHVRLRYPSQKLAAKPTVPASSARRLRLEALPSGSRQDPVQLFAMCAVQPCRTARDTENPNLQRLR